jgi:MFS family permease
MSHTPTAPAGRWRALRRFAVDFTPLRQSRDWRLLFIGQAVSSMGEQVRVVVIPYLVFLITHSSFIVGLVSLSQFIPTMLLALVGGTLADRVDRRRLLIVTQAVTVAVSVPLMLAAWRGLPPLWLIFVVMPAATGISAVAAPAARAVEPRLVGREQLANAMALDQVTWNLSAVLAPVLGGVLIAKLGVGPALVFNVAALAARLLLLFPLSPLPPELGQGPLKSGVESVKEGFTYLKDKPALLSTFLIDINAMVFGFPSALMPALATQVFKVGAGGLGFLYAAPAAGALAGSVVTGWVNHVRRQGRAVVIAVCIWGVAIAAFGLLTHSFLLALLMLAIAGGADMFSAVFRQTILQLSVPDRLRGRLSAVHFLVVTSGPRLGDVEAGSVAALTSTQFSVVSGGVGSVIGALVIAAAIPAFWRYDVLTSRETLDAQAEDTAAASPAAPPTEQTPTAG